MPTLEFTALEMRFLEALALISLACLFVPLSRRMGLGTVIGYLVAGLTAGAILSLSYSEHPEELLHAEFGVVIFLFVIALSSAPLASGRCAAPFSGVALRRSSPAAPF
jgi:Kef-type K+ transport system membrane component KefB